MLVEEESDTFASMKHELTRQIFIISLVMVRTIKSTTQNLDVYV
jgi:hypothetical protein